MPSGDWPSRFAFMQKALDDRRKHNSLRSLHTLKRSGSLYLQDEDGKSYLNFASNDYLGLGYDSAQLQDLNLPSSASSSRLICGQHPQLIHLESYLASLFGDECSAFVFPSTFQLNLGLFSALVGKEDLIITDKYAHNSLIQGALLSRAKLIRFRHNDLAHAESLVKKHKGQYRRILIAVESVYSMHGSLLDTDAFQKLCEAYDLISVVDEAHAFGVFGDQGLGRFTEGSFPDFRIGALGKSAGSQGGFMVFPSAFKDYLANFMSSLIYSTAISPAQATLIKKKLERMVSYSDKRTHLKAIFTDLIAQIPWSDLLDSRLAPSFSPIIPIFVRSEEDALHLRDKAKEKGLFLAAIRPPTVPKGHACIRVSLSAAMQSAHIAQLIDFLRSTNIPLFSKPIA